MLTTTLATLLMISFAAGVYAFAEGHRGMRKSIAWSISLVAGLILAGMLLTEYLRFVLKGFPMDW